ncbi:MAG: LCP family protein [bacterium]|nr:LCP family protein [bacterium]
MTVIKALLRHALTLFLELIIAFTQWRRFGVFVSAFLGGVLGFIFVLYWALLLSQGALIEGLVAIIPKDSLQGVNVLVVGIDNTKTVQRSDTIVLLHLNEVKNRIGVLSIPRDTHVNIPGYGMTKINHAYAHGGMSLLQQTVSSFLNIPIDYYVQVNLSGVEKIVDELGGIPIHVEKALKYDDFAGDLHIDLQAGDQVLSGKDASAYLRFRRDSKGDIGRIDRQQQFLKSVTEKVLESGNLLSSPRLLRKLVGMVNTNLSLRQMLGFVRQFGRAFVSNRFQSGTVPGAVTLIDGVSYWRPDITAMDEVVDRVLFGFDEVAKLPAPVIETATPQPTERKVQTPPANVVVVAKEKAPKRPDPPQEDAQWRQATKKEVSRIANQTDLADDRSLTIAQNTLKLEILNGVGAEGLATRVTKFMAAKGYQIIRVDNSKHFDYAETKIVDWKDNLQTVLVMANDLGIDPKNIVIYDRPSKPLDVTLVIGDDWERIFPVLPELEMLSTEDVKNE